MKQKSPMEKACDDLRLNDAGRALFKSICQSIYINEAWSNLDEVIAKAKDRLLKDPKYSSYCSQDTK